jgi:hypothetical protein
MLIGYARISTFEQNLECRMSGGLRNRSRCGRADVACFPGACPHRPTRGDQMTGAATAAIRKLSLDFTSPGSLPREQTQRRRYTAVKVDPTEARKQVRPPDEPSRQVKVKVATNPGSRFAVGWVGWVGTDSDGV